MGNRFGRQQKRQMRAAIAERDNQVEQLLAVLDERNRRLSASLGMIADLQWIIHEARRVLGEYWVGLPPQEVKVDRIPEDNWERIRLHLPFSPAELRPYDQQEILASMSKAINYIEMMCMRGEFRFDDYRQEAHVIFRTPQGDAAYAFSKMTFRRCDPQFVAARLAKQMAEFLVSNEPFCQLVGRP